MRIEFREARKIPTNNGTQLSSFPIKEIIITNDDCTSLQIHLCPADLSKACEIRGQLISTKRVCEAVDEEYIGFEVFDLSSAKNVVILGNENNNNLDIKKALDTLVMMNLIHKDTANEILQNKNVSQLMTEEHQLMADIKSRLPISPV